MFWLCVDLFNSCARRTDSPQGPRAPQRPRSSRRILIATRFPNRRPKWTSSSRHRIDFEVSLSANHSFAIEEQLKQNNKAAAGVEQRLLMSSPHVEPSDQPDTSQEFLVTQNLNKYPALAVNEKLPPGRIEILPILTNSDNFSSSAHLHRPAGDWWRSACRF